MIGSIVEIYQKSIINMTTTLSDIDNIAIESEFYDEGYINVQLNKIKKELSKISNELKQSIEYGSDSDYDKRKIIELESKREQLIFDFVYLSSNSFNNLEICKTMLEGYSCDFIDCIQALIAYKKGKDEIAFELLENYYIKKNCLQGHYLINKIFGILLMKYHKFDDAIKFLRYSAEFMPEDIEIHEDLLKLYIITNNDRGIKVEEDIIHLLQRT